MRRVSCGFGVGGGGALGMSVTGGGCGVRDCLERHNPSVVVGQRIKGEASKGMRFLASMSRGGESDLHGGGDDLETRCWRWL
jgi:hypothetical protein